MQKHNVAMGYEQPREPRTQRTEDITEIAMRVASISLSFTNENYVSGNDRKAKTSSVRLFPATSMAL